MISAAHFEAKFDVQMRDGSVKEVFVRQTRRGCSRRHGEGGTESPVREFVCALLQLPWVNILVLVYLWYVYDIIPMENDHRGIPRSSGDVVVRH